MSGSVAYQKSANWVTFEAGEDLTNYVGHFVKLSSGQIVHCAVLGEEHIGVLTVAASAQGLACSVAIPGGCAKVKVAEALATPGTKIIPNVTTGKGINTGLSSGHVVGAITLEAASGDGSLVECMLTHFKH